MDKQHKSCILNFALLRNVVDVQSAQTSEFNVARKHGRLMSLCFGLAQVKPVLQVCDEPLRVDERRVVLPASIVQPVRSANHARLLVDKIEQ